MIAREIYQVLKGMDFQMNQAGQNTTAGEGRAGVQSECVRQLTFRRHSAFHKHASLGDVPSASWGNDENRH